MKFRVTNIEKIREKRLDAIRTKKAKLSRKRNEKEERALMKHEDYDVTNVLAGLVEAINSEEEEEEEESEIMMEDESFFEVVPETQDDSNAVDMEKSNASGKTGKTKDRMTGRSMATKKSNLSKNDANQGNLNASGVSGSPGARIYNSRFGVQSRQGTRENFNRQGSRVSRMNRSGTLMSRGNTINRSQNMN